MAGKSGARQGRALSEIKWLPEAIADIERLHDFLKCKNPDGAARAAKAVLEGADLLKSNPAMGRPMPDDTGRREWFVPFAAGSYVLRYILEGDTVVVIRVWHSRENRAQ